MVELLYRTKGNSLPNKKPRVYFTCHPDDFDKSFNKICEDIFKTHDCAIYYTADMTAAFDEQNLDTDLGSMNLFVVPVTFKLLTKPNRAMDFDFSYAQKNHIPVLPIMLEPGIDDFYSHPDKFGELQYLNPYSTDLTEISYEDKLKKYLESVLISDEIAKRVRAAFDAYIFLSYRKKDRRYANELMRLIHAKPEFRDIAIWYDEFLTPGESFNGNIGKMLNDSKLFALLVTPNLLEEPNGKPNFVMGEEYPMAKNSGMDILPAEMEDTDKNELISKFDGIPECVNPYDDDLFKERLLKSITKIATTENDDNPEHNFLIGLAYLFGIDVEINRERGIELITKAAEADLPEAMWKLYELYSGILADYRKAVVWAEKIADICIKEYGAEHSCTLRALQNLAVIYIRLGDYQKALELTQKVYESLCELLGGEPLDTLTVLAVTYGYLGDYQKAHELFQKVYELLCKAFGAEHHNTLIALHNLAATYRELGDYQKAHELSRKAYESLCKTFGEEDPGVLITLGGLAVAYEKLGDYQKAFELSQKVYELSCNVLGEEHPDTLTALQNLAVIYIRLGDYQKALELFQKAYESRCKVLGEEHPDTLKTGCELAFAYERLGDHQKAFGLSQKLYELRCNVLGEEHPDTLTALHNFAEAVYTSLGNHQKALELFQKAYESRCRVLGEEHPDTLITVGELAVAHWEFGDYQKAIYLFEKIYAYRCKVFGDEHADTIKVKEKLEAIRKKLKIQGE